MAFACRDNHYYPPKGAESGGPSTGDQPARQNSAPAANTHKPRATADDNTPPSQALPKTRNKTPARELAQAAELLRKNIYTQNHQLQYNSKAEL